MIASPDPLRRLAVTDSLDGGAAPSHSVRHAPTRPSAAAEKERSVPNP